MPNFNTDNFKIGACIIAYKGKMLGATHDDIKISIADQTTDISCDQSYGMPVKRVVFGHKITISMTMLEVDGSLNLLLSDNKITNLTIGNDLMKQGGELLLTPINDNDNTGYRFPNALLEPYSEYDLQSIAVHKVKLKFTAQADNNGVFLEKVTL